MYQCTIQVVGEVVRLLCSKALLLALAVSGFQLAMEFAEDTDPVVEVETIQLFAPKFRNRATVGRVTCCTCVPG